MSIPANNGVHSSGPAGEAELAAAVVAQSRIFAEAIRTIENLQGDVDLRNPSSQPAISQLQSALDKVASAQFDVAAAHQRFKQTGRRLSIGMQDQLHDHEEMLRQLLVRIDQVQKRFESAKEDLIPKMDHDVRRRSMHSAYKQSLRTI